MPYTYNNINPEREGACAKDFWAIFYRLPQNSHVTVLFFDSLNTETPLDQIAFTKCGCNRPYEDAPEVNIQKIRDCFKKYGYESFRRIFVDWRKGFGNSVIIGIELDIEQ